MSTIARRSAGPLRHVLRQPGQMMTRQHQIRAVSYGKDDLGGPGGQVPPPAKPGGGPEIVKRNWLPIGGAALGVVALFYFFSGPNPKPKAEAKKLARDASNAVEKVGDEMSRR